MKQRFVAAFTALLLTGALVIAAPAGAESPACTAADALCYQPAAEALIQKITTVTEPPIAVPAWLE